MILIRVFAQTCWDRPLGWMRRLILNMCFGREKFLFFWLNTQSLKILCIVTLSSVQVYINVQECKLLYTSAMCIMFSIRKCRLPVLSQFLIIPILVFVTVLTIYLSDLVELFILCCSGASLLSFLYFYTVFNLICFYCTVLFKLFLSYQDASSTHWLASMWNMPWWNKC